MLIFLTRLQKSGETTSQKPLLGIRRIVFADYTINVAFVSLFLFKK